MKHRVFRMALVSCLLISSLLVGGTAAYADDGQLPKPRITPDSPFYLFDNWGKSIGLFLAFSPEAKARKALEYAEERLAEAQAMADKNKDKEMIRAADDYNRFISIVNEKAEQARQKGASDNISERVALAVSRHLSVLDKIEDRIPEQAKEAIAHAREVSINGQINALRALAKTKLERALDITSDAIEKQMERARAKASENMTAEKMTSNVEEALKRAARIAGLEDEVIAIARQKGIDVTAVEKHLAQSTSNRLEVLARVHEKVPEKARAAIENAIENSVRKYERTVEQLKEKKALGKIPEEAAALHKMQEQVRERLKAKAPNQAHVSDNITGKKGTQIEIRQKPPEKVGEPTPPDNKTRQNTHTEVNPQRVGQSRNP